LEGFAGRRWFLHVNLIVKRFKYSDVRPHFLFAVIRQKLIGQLAALLHIKIPGAAVDRIPGGKPIPL
ncbi:MAG: hypothetical protein KA202_04535, partial [Enterocloster sp.]|nr:hypothetical protein [Enterocloster sp.]